MACSASRSPSAHLCCSQRAYARVTSAPMRPTLPESPAAVRFSVPGCDILSPFEVVANERECGQMYLTDPSAAISSCFPACGKTSRQILLGFGLADCTQVKNAEVVEQGRIVFLRFGCVPEPDEANGNKRPPRARSRLAPA